MRKKQALDESETGLVFALSTLFYSCFIFIWTHRQQIIDVADQAETQSQFLLDPEKRKVKRSYHHKVCIGSVQTQK